MKKFFIRIFDIRRIIKRKNAQIRAEREKLMAAETANRIYAAYILYFAAKEGAVRVPKGEIAGVVGKYRAEISATEDEYIISVREIAPGGAAACSEKSACDRDDGNFCSENVAGGAAACFEKSAGDREDGNFCSENVAGDRKDGECNGACADKIGGEVVEKD